MGGGGRQGGGWGGGGRNGLANELRRAKNFLQGKAEGIGSVLSRRPFMLVVYTQKTLSHLLRSLGGTTNAATTVIFGGHCNTCPGTQSTMSG